MCDVLLALGLTQAAMLGCLVNVPELHPPVEQEGVIGHLVGGQLGTREALGILTLGVDAIRPVVGAGLLHGTGGHLHVSALEHGARGLVVIVTQEVVIDVRVQLLTRVCVYALGVGHVTHHGVAVSGAVARVHGGHLGHLLLVLHRGAGRRAGCDTRDRLEVSSGRRWGDDDRRGLSCTSVLNGCDYGTMGLLALSRGGRWKV